MLGIQLSHVRFYYHPIYKKEMLRYMIYFQILMTLLFSKVTCLNVVRNGMKIKIVSMNPSPPKVSSIDTVKIQIKFSNTQDQLQCLKNLENIFYINKCQL